MRTLPTLICTCRDCLSQRPPAHDTPEPVASTSQFLQTPAHLDNAVFGPSQLSPTLPGARTITPDASPEYTFPCNTATTSSQDLPKSKFPHTNRESVSQSLGDCEQTPEVIIEPEEMAISLAPDDDQLCVLLEPTYAELQAKQRRWSTKVGYFEDRDVSRHLQPTTKHDNRGTPFDHFMDMFPDELFQLIVENTNKYANIKGSQFWKDVDSNEIKAFLAIVILMGITPQSDIELYWNSDPFYNNQEISGTMPCKRFKKILQNIHVCDITTHLPQNHKDYDKLQKIRPMLNILNKTFQENATNSQSQLYSLPTSVYVCMHM